MPTVNSLPGNPAVGDKVKTLHLKRAVYGVVTRVQGHYAFIEGETQPGQPTQRLKVHFENLAIEERVK
jgi:hypothetical protein